MHCLNLYVRDLLNWVLLSIMNITAVTGIFAQWCCCNDISMHFTHPPQKRRNFYTSTLFWSWNLPQLMTAYSGTFRILACSKYNMTLLSCVRNIVGVTHVFRPYYLVHYHEAKHDNSVDNIWKCKTWHNSIFHAMDLCINGILTESLWIFMLKLKLTVIMHTQLKICCLSLRNVKIITKQDST